MRFPVRRRRRTPAGAAILSLSLLGGCVTVTTKSTGRFGAPTDDPGFPTRPAPAARPSQTSAPLSVPGPRAVSSHVRFAVKPLGRVPYDGMVLPLTSLDGHYLVAEQGEAPTWPARLAQDGAVIPQRTTLAIYRLSDASVQQMAIPGLPAGLLLGRSADKTGFLVESPRADGSRWLGKVDWDTGTLAWLVQSDDVNAQATLTAGGDLLYTRRRPGEPRAELVLHPLNSPGAPDLVLSTTTESFHFPVCGDDPAQAVVLVASVRGIEAGLVPIPSPADPAATLQVSARAFLSPPADLMTLYQIGAPLQTPIPAPEGAMPIGAIPVFHPVQMQMAVLTAGGFSIEPLIVGSFSAAPLRGEDGARFLVSTPGGMVDVSTGSRPGQPQTVISGRTLARATIRADRFVLVGPAPLSTGFAAEISLLGAIEPESP